MLRAAIAACLLALAQSQAPAPSDNLSSAMESVSTAVGISTLPPTQRVELPLFDMSGLTPEELSGLTPEELATPCGNAFKLARTGAYVCMETAKTAVNTGATPATVYYQRLCQCKDVFDNLMSTCVVSTPLIQARVAKTDASFTGICLGGEKSTAGNTGTAIAICVGACACAFLCVMGFLVRLRKQEEAKPAKVHPVQAPHAQAFQGEGHRLLE